MIWESLNKRAPLVIKNSDSIDSVLLTECDKENASSQRSEWLLNNKSEFI